MKHKDPYLRFLDEIPESSSGLSKIENSKTLHGVKNVIRSRETGVNDEYRNYIRSSNELLCRGVALGIGPDRVVRHIQPWNAPQDFVGFCLKNLQGDRVLVQTRGAFFLKIPDCRVGDRGRDIYCESCNEFTLNPSGLIIGKIRFVQPDMVDRASVAFKRFDDPTPVELLWG